MCSSIGSKAKVIEAVEAGAKNYILKPFEAQKVLDVVAAVLNG
jgi:two-component system chemotaxis response regulator CheY